MTNPLYEEYRARIEEWVAKGVSMATSADKLYALLRDTDLYAPRAIVREVWAEEVRSQGYMPLINRLDDEALIPRAWMKTTYANYDEAYALKVLITGVDAITGESKEHYITLESKTQLTAGEIRQQAADYLYHYHFKLEPGLSTISFASVLHKQGEGW